MTRKEYLRILRQDYLQYSTDESLKGKIWVMLSKPGYNWSRHYRKMCYLRSQKMLKPFYMISRLRYHRFCVKYGIEIPGSNDNIGEGFHMEHFCCIMIHPDTPVGKNVTIRPKTVIGAKDGYAPVIGDNVDIGVGATIVGDVKVGNNAVIGANAMVTHDVPENAVVAGNPAKVLYITESRQE